MPFYSIPVAGTLRHCNYIGHIKESKFIASAAQSRRILRGPDCCVTGRSTLCSYHHRPLKTLVESFVCFTDCTLTNRQHLKAKMSLFVSPGFTFKNSIFSTLKTLTRLNSGFHRGWEEFFPSSGFLPSVRWIYTDVSRLHTLSTFIQVQLRQHYL
jgi:hypothetical protein